MTEPIANTPSPQPLARAAGVSNAARKSVDDSTAVRFQAMLDQIGRTAESLKAQSRQELSRDSLGDAVDNARTSLEQVLSLKDRLLEEWRATQQRGPA